jgi:hypothetical protein
VIPSQPARRSASAEELSADILLKASWIVAGVAAAALLLMLAGAGALRF